MYRDSKTGIQVPGPLKNAILGLTNNNLKNTKVKDIKNLTKPRNLFVLS